MGHRRPREAPRPTDPICLLRRSQGWHFCAPCWPRRPPKKSGKKFFPAADLRMPQPRNHNEMVYRKATYVQFCYTAKKEANLGSIEMVAQVRRLTCENHRSSELSVGGDQCSLTSLFPAILFTCWCASSPSGPLVCSGPERWSARCAQSVLLATVT